MSLNIVKRTREIGMRKILGASTLHIAKIIQIEFIYILLIASLVGGVLGFFATDGMMDAVWEYYQKVNFLTLGIAITSLFGIALTAVAYKTITTALMNPVHTLKSE